ncbi:MAG: alpha/beta hydrolase [Ferruginibacter sp.]
MKLIQFTIAVLLTVSVVSCKKNNNTTGGGATTNPLTAQTILNVSYGTDPLQKMDVYLPANRSTASTKVMVMIHGGAWSSGDKADFSTLTNGMVITDTMKNRLPEYAIINVNYRLSNGSINLFPSQENDIKAALQFIFDKSAEYVISNKYVLVGASAGAHLAMLQGYKYSVPIKPKAIVSIFGPSDLVDMYNNPAAGNTTLTLALAAVMGATPATNAALYASSSPVTYIGAGSPPTILLHGSNDPLVSASQSLAVKNKLATAGVINQYVLYPGKGHGDDWGDVLYKDAFNNIQAFLTANVQ